MHMCMLLAIDLLWLVYIVGHHVVDKNRCYIYCVAVLCYEFIWMWPLNLCFVQVEDQTRDDEECSFLFSIIVGLIVIL